IIRQSKHDLDLKFLALADDFPLVAPFDGVYEREVRADVQLFREENIPLATDLELLSQEYQTICGAMVVFFDGEERTLPQMSQYLQNPDRRLRETAWRAVAERRLSEQARFNELFDRMVALRTRQAQNAGFDQFTPYQFRIYHRFDYTPRQCFDYHQAAQEMLVPLWEKILRRRQKALKMDTLKPWDADVDPLGRPALNPFKDVDDLKRGVENILKKIHPEFFQAFKVMSDDGLLDLASRKGKAPGGYQHTLAEARKPFIFMNAVGLDGDVRTLLHESGHAFHALACASHALYSYRHAPMEFCKVASMSMELLGGEFLSEFYNEEDQRRSHEKHFEDIVWTLLWVATIDAFQHWIYAHPGHSPQERTQAWLKTYYRFGGDLFSWEGLESYAAILWQRQLHIFEVPFYYIEYAIAQIGALQIGLNIKKNRIKTLEKFREALALGGSRPLPELFRAAGLEFDFTAGTLAPLISAIEGELAL
ncbi:MAG: M3 family oligoendopeptidase, partial [Candidatus Omnitrophota bacterium]